MCFSVLIIENRVFWIELWIPKLRCGLVGLVPGSCPIFDFWKNRWWCKFVNTPNSIFKKLDFNIYNPINRCYSQNRLKKSVCPIDFLNLRSTAKCPHQQKERFFSAAANPWDFWSPAGYPWISIDIHRYPLISMDTYWYLFDKPSLCFRPVLDNLHWAA